MCRTEHALLLSDNNVLLCVQRDSITPHKLLRKIYKDLRRKGDEKKRGVDMQEFLKLTELSGQLSEQLFRALDRNHDEVLDSDEFISGFVRLFSGTQQEIAQIIFTIMDFGLKGFVTLADMLKVINNLPYVCSKCGKSVNYTWHLDTQAAIFEESHMLCYGSSAELLSAHSVILKDIAEAIMDSFPVVFEEAVKETMHNVRIGEECLVEPTELLSVKALKFKGRRYYFGVKNECLYGYYSCDQTYVKKLILLKDLFVNPIGNREFELKNRNVTYTFETSSEEERDEWVERILSEKRFRWFDDFYIVKEKLGLGAYGQVFKAISRTTGESVAVKIISKEAMSEKAEERLRREVSILRYIQHPNVLRLYDVFETFERIYIVTELLEGGTLFQYLEKRAFSVPEKFTKRVVRDIASGLMYLHSNGIAHRDLKLENVMLRRQSEEEGNAVLIDFGLSLYLGLNQTTNEAVGTLKYVAPEVISRLHYDFRVDSWSFGVIAYILLNGEMPFFGETDQEIAQRILKRCFRFCRDKIEKVNSQAFEIIFKLLERKPDSRWSPRDVLNSRWLNDDESPLLREDGHAEKLPLFVTTHK